MMIKSCIVIVASFPLRNSSHPWLATHILLVANVPFATGDAALYAPPERYE